MEKNEFVPSILQKTCRPKKSRTTKRVRFANDENLVESFEEFRFGTLSPATMLKTVQKEKFDERKFEFVTNSVSLSRSPENVATKYFPDLTKRKIPTRKKRKSSQKNFEPNEENFLPSIVVNPKKLVEIRSSMNKTNPVGFLFSTNFLRELEPIDLSPRNTIHSTKYFLLPTIFHPEEKLRKFS